MKMDKILIFGHKKPDTDTTTSAIAYSYLKNKLGFNTEPCLLGELNNETKWVLKYWNVKTPKYIDDVKLQVKDINYRKGYFINEHDSVEKAVNYMTDKGISTIPVVDKDNKFIGALAMKDIARNETKGNFRELNASYDHILETLNGQEILRFNDKINGDIEVAGFKSTTFIENININHKTILIVGNRHSIIEYAVNNGAQLLIITGDGEIKPEHLEIAKKNHVNIIKTNRDTFDVAVHINLANDVIRVPFSQDFICFTEDDHVDDLVEVSNKKRYSYYPIVDKEKHCLGLIKLADLHDRNPKKVILVDHNELEQSADGIEEANIVEIVDHHKIGNLVTSMPINFRNMPVGSTNTIIFKLYEENKIEIPQQIAGIMASGIISDTLLLKSPTTTDMDKDALAKLSSIADIDATTYGYELFKAGSSLEGKTKEEILYNDFKNFDINNNKIGIGQIFTMDISYFEKNKATFVELINKVAKQNGYYIVALFITDIVKNGSYIIYNDSATDTLGLAFNINIKEGSYIDGCVSRKKQIIPSIMDIIN
jgi:manganese-dependent inorganic pyrophosphatase